MVHGGLVPECKPVLSLRHGLLVVTDKYMVSRHYCPSQLHNVPLRPHPNNSSPPPPPEDFTHAAYGTYQQQQSQQRQQQQQAFQTPWPTVASYPRASQYYPYRTGYLVVTYTSADRCMVSRHGRLNLTARATSWPDTSADRCKASHPSLMAQATSLSNGVPELLVHPYRTSY